ncbi:hypothetical protein [Nodosilinea sp. FACHB-13]|uniref:hypothetical protein n=1 Tax=Cyanophyceae TaxID=3028117 RepID=UPI001686A5BB|nr:hypothetical protein [Nodosilinea sp. FACHB-13]MBD2106316.1 hypothetical protein [Nodosilinea sp. FACHB-13]
MGLPVSSWPAAGPTTCAWPAEKLDDISAIVLVRARARFTAFRVAGLIIKPFDPFTLAQQIANLLHWAL